MSYQTYTTEALVCGSKDSYTSDRSYLLFTERAGMLWAAARSVREERSRQRYALQEFSLVRVSLVRGKTGWRIGSVTALNNAYHSSPERQTRGAVTKIFRLLRQYLHGEDAPPAIFSDTRAVLSRLAKDGRECDAVLDFFTLRFLYHLGYIAPHSSYQSLIDGNELPTDVSILSSEARRAITQAGDVSHL